MSRFTTDKAPVVTPDRADAPVLEIEELTVEFLTDVGWRPVVEDVGFSVDRGEVVGLVGESGSGKSVTCLSITQLLPARTSRIATGRILLDGRDLRAVTPRQLEDVRGREISMIFQEPMTSLNPAFTVGEQIAEVVRRHRGSSRRDATLRAVEMLDAVGIAAPKQRIHAYPHELSGGMLQRAMIAMALSCEPSLLIADEPTTALDVTVQAQVLDVLRSMCAEFGTGVLFVTHDLGVVADLCDRVVVMYAGQVVEQAPIETLFDAPNHPYSCALLDALPQLGARRGRLSSIPGVAPRAGRFPTGCRFHPRCPASTEACAAESVDLEFYEDGRASRCIRRTELFAGGTP
ncbi:MAG: ABC transporter ATP-binding protein [Ilumatobacteraceae bacterium]|nr:ABC transporter ATP-binding protein [Ilumatobacteraceae bacterium]